MIVSLVALTLWALTVVAMLGGTWAAFARISRRSAHRAPLETYPVTILKPVKGLDPGLERNLESFFALDYPEFELLLSVASERDPACELIRRLIARRPDVDARLFIGELEIGPNPKVNNLAQAYRAAKYDWILISDSNTRAEPDFLRRQIAQLDPGVGMVTSVVAGQEGEGLGGGLETTFLNTYYARWMCLAERFGRPCVVGKSMLFRKSDAARFGGIQVLGRYLAEDYMAGEAMRRLGRRVMISTEPVTQVIGRKSLREFWARHIRWGRIRKSQSILAFCMEPFGGAILPGVMGAFAAERLFGFPPASFICLHLLVWAFCDFCLLLRVGREVGAMTGVHWIIRELTAFPLWIHIASGNQIEWRGGKFRLLPGGLIAC